MTTILCTLFKKMFPTLKSWRYFSVLSSEHFLASHLGYDPFGIDFFAYCQGSCFPHTDILHQIVKQQQQNHSYPFP